MGIFTTILFGFTAVVAVFNLILELLRDLMMLQQNSYRNERYNRWLKQSQDTTSWLRLFALIVVLFAGARFASPTVSMVLILAVAAWSSYRLMTARYKKPLVMTKRAWRIFGAASVLCVAALAAVSFAAGSLDDLFFLYGFTSLLLYCLSHALTLFANWILKPVEKSINQKYYRDAERILHSMPGLKVVGVTGSYGKTSTKHYLYRILSEKYDTCMTPGSFNTTLGVIRTVREYLKPYNEVFICEMGAKQPGDVREICELVRPEIGIVTAVGEQHLESFKTIENVQRTKFELVDSLPVDGLAVVNDDFPYVANRDVDNVRVERYAVNATDRASYCITGLTYSADGTHFTVITPSGERLEFHTRLVGECNVSNLTAAIIVALYLQVPVEKIRYAVEKIEQVEHRLQVKRTPAGITILDDAFNSNPTGSAMALDVLGAMEGGKRIIITPGMIELGDRQYELNKLFGKKIASSSDLAFVVGEYNRDAILEGLREGGMSENKICEFPTFAAAQAYLQTIVTKGDTVLYENDLPDTFK